MRPGFYAIVYRIVVSVVLASLFAFGRPQHASAGRIIHVRPVGNDYADGTTWYSAYGSVGYALSEAESGDQVWVAKGTYKTGPAGADRTWSFHLPDGVAVYGGFNATESYLSQRNPALNVTILSGDIGVSGSNADNAYHVVVANGVSSSSILDGFTITGGNANGAAPDNVGGGIYIDYLSSPTLANLIFTGNAAATNGGAIYAEGDIALNNFAFTGNSAGESGGAVSAQGRVNLTSGSFSGNSAADGGALWALSDDDMILTTVTFSNNSASNTGGAILAISPGMATHAQLTNVRFQGNSATKSGGAVEVEGMEAWTSFNNAIFSGNSAADGGAVWTDGYYTHTSFTNATFSGNSAANGGAIYIGTEGSAYLTNATLTGNTSTSGIGAVYNGHYVTLTHVTMSGNPRGALYNDSGSKASIMNTILWGDVTEVPSPYATSIVVKDSVIQGGCPSNPALICTHILIGDPKLRPLQDNGGLPNTLHTQSMALGIGTSAIDISTLNCSATDQRGVARTQGLGCDAGAYELRAMSFKSRAASDGYVMETGKNTNQGGTANSTGLALLVGDNAQNRRYRGILSFDTSRLPDKATIASAQIRLLKQSLVGDPFGKEGNLIADLANPYFGTTLYLNGYDFQAVAAVSSATNRFLPADGDWYRAALKPVALPRINKQQTTQFRLRFVSEQYNNAADYIGFYSGNMVDASYRPVLWVYYP